MITTMIYSLSLINEKKYYLHYLLLPQKAWNELINPCVNLTGSLRLDGRFGDYSCSAGKPGHEKCLHLIRTVKIGQKVFQVYTSLEQSVLGNKSRMLKGILHPLPSPSRTPPSSFRPCTLLLQDGRLSAERPCPWHKADLHTHTQT